MLGLGPLEILILAVVVGLALGAVAYALRRGPQPPPPEVPPRRESQPDPSWRDKVVFPVIVSVISSVLTAVILYFLGLKK